MCFALAGAAFQMMPFFVAARIIKNMIFGSGNMQGYIADCSLMAFMWLMRVLFHSLSTSESHQATFTVLGNIRKQCLEKLAKMPLGNVQAIGAGELKNILVERIDSMEPTLAHVIPEMTSNAAVTLATLVYLFCLDWRMALACVATVPAGMVFFALMMSGYEKNYARTVRATKALNDSAVEYIGGIEVIKVFGRVKGSYEKFASAAKECAESYIEWMNKSNFYFTFAMNVMPVTLLTVLPVGGLLMKSGTLAPDKFVLTVILAMGLVTPLIGCMKFTDDLAKVGTVISEVASILDAPELPRPEKSIDALQGGTVNALVGPSGSGKSTIAKLIASFWDVKSGCIKINGTDIRKISSADFNKLVAYVSQDNFLFNTTVRENIRMGKHGAADSEVEKAAKDCGCYDFIMDLENGFDTTVGNGGSKLSGGERQRVAIVRAMLKNAPVVIFDEATANVDPENENELMSAIEELTHEKTVIMIAHRLKTVQNADMILVVDKGKIVQSGTHEELAAQEGIYRNFVSGRKQAASWKIH